MDKVKLEFKLPESKTIEYSEAKFELTPFLGLAQQAFLINQYIEEYFTKSEGSLIVGSEYDYLGAEVGLMNYIIQVVTNIDFENFDNDLYVDPDLYYGIISEIVNYEEFRERLDFIVNEIKDQKVLNNTLGKVISNLIDKAYPLLESLGNIQPEEIEKAKETGLELIKKLEASSVLGNKPMPSTPIKRARKKKSQ